MPLSKNNFYIVILAGGAGTRFWPLSRARKPKQFLKIVGNKSLFRQTLERVRPEVKDDHIFIAANAEYKSQIRQESKGFKIPSANFLLEPSGKNTAPSICWAAARIHATNPDAIIAVLPSDHLITKKKAFLKTLRQACVLAQQDYLVTMGIVPTRAETGYGYLKTVRLGSKGKSILKVQKFIEKPDVKKAKKYLKSKSYLWNSGMFVWRASVVLEEFKRYAPSIYRLFNHSHSQSGIKKFWKTLTKISVDYAILEKSRRVAAVPAQSIGWSDLGSWEALAETLSKDRQGNSLRGNIFNIDTGNTLVQGNQKLIATVGVKDLVVVDTPDALLICSKNSSQKIRDIVSTLQKQKKGKLL